MLKRLKDNQRDIERKQAVKELAHYNAVTNWHAKTALVEQSRMRNRRKKICAEELQQGNNEMRISRRAKLKDLLEREMQGYREELSKRGLVFVTEDM